MNLRWRLSLYGTIVLIIISVILLTHFYQNPMLFLVCELALICLAIHGFKLILNLFKPLELLAETTRRLSEKEFTTRLAPLGHPETDRLVAVYNTMIENLRQQRIHNQEQEYFLKKILKTTHSAILTFDFDQRIAQVNPAAESFLEINGPSLIGKTLAELDSPFTTSLNQLPMDQPMIIPFRGQRRLRCIRSSYLDRGFPKSYIFMDELTAELRQAEKAAYEKLIRVMTHEINNSLGAVHSLLHSCLNYATQINDEDRTDFRTALEVIISRTEHLKTFVSDYVSVIKLPQPKFSPVDLVGLLQHVQYLLSAELKRRQIDWVWHLTPTADIAMDALQMEQVFLNIAKNALEAIGQEGTITIHIENQEGRLCLIFADTGNGISQETEAHLFTPFYTTKTDGVGIGLTLVAEVLNNHAFEFTLESHPGNTTNFSIWF